MGGELLGVSRGRCWLVLLVDWSKEAVPSRVRFHKYNQVTGVVYESP